MEEVEEALARSRQIFSGSTSSSHASETSENLTIAAYKGYALYKVSVSEPSWVTLYVSTDTVNF